MYKRHPHGHGGDKELVCTSWGWKSGRTAFGREESPNSSLSHAKMDFSLLHLVGNTSLSVQSFPRSGSPSCSWWVRDVQHTVPIPWWPWQIFQGSPPGCWASLSHAFSHHITHTCFSTLWLQLSQGILDGCVSQGLFLLPELKFPGFSVAVMLWPLVCPPHHSSGSSTQEKVPGRENWEFVYPKAMAVNWLQLFLKIFLGFDHSSRRQQEKHK